MAYLFAAAMMALLHAQPAPSVPPQAEGPTLSGPLSPPIVRAPARPSPRLLEWPGNIKTIGVPNDGAPPRPVKALPSHFPSFSYPTLALRNEEQGVVLTRLHISDRGRVERCDVTSSSGSAALDHGTCRIYIRKAQFEPARDAAGKPIASVMVGFPLRWQFDDEPLQSSSTSDADYREAMTKLGVLNGARIDVFEDESFRCQRREPSGLERRCDLYETRLTEPRRTEWRKTDLVVGYEEEKLAGPTHAFDAGREEYRVVVSDVGTPFATCWIEVHAKSRSFRLCQEGESRVVVQGEGQLPDGPLTLRTLGPVGTD